MIVDDIEVFDLIRDERARQDAQWGGPEHDDTHTAFDWMTYIQKQLDKYGRAQAFELERDAFVKIAALAVAAIESLDRKANVQGGNAGQEGVGKA